MNRCPGCQVRIKADQVACKEHWFKLPKELRTRIWKLYQDQAGSDEHRAAVFEAVAILAPVPEQTKVKCLKCGFLIDKAGPCEQHSPFRQTKPEGMP